MTYFNSMWFWTVTGFQDFRGQWRRWKSKHHSSKCEPVCECVIECVLHSKTLHKTFLLPTPALYVKQRLVLSLLSQPQRAMPHCQVNLSKKGFLDPLHQQAILGCQQGIQKFNSILMLSTCLQIGGSKDSLQL